MGQPKLRWENKMKEDVEKVMLEEDWKKLSLDGKKTGDKNTEWYDL